MASTEPTSTTGDRIKGAFFGALVADALSLGSHYEYDAAVIKQAYGDMISEYMGPGEKMGGTTHGIGWGRRNYHPGQKKGDQTDYGEYNVLMLEYLAGRKGEAGQLNQPVVLQELIPVWKDRLSKNWGAWICTQSKQALEMVSAGYPLRQLGGNSNAMGIRSAAALGAYDDEDVLAEASRAMLFTHRSSEALDGAEFFARVAFKLVHSGQGGTSYSVLEAIEATGQQMSPWIQAQVLKGVSKFHEATDPAGALSKEEYVNDLAMTSMARLWDVGKTEPIKVGKASPTEGTMPSSIYMILKYEDDLELAAKANAMVGGDNASRGIAIGMVLGAKHGIQAIRDPKLRQGLNAWEHCESLLNKLPLLQEKQAKQEL
ncbi:hypothetical protein FOA52_013264 [Chlamydomonas sp. UWO 241]|nr:hypothetical protein FOA52_013264 [Chlamydomonas sp. UWO 241]